MAKSKRGQGINMKAKYTGTCSYCKKPAPAGTWIWYYRKNGTIEHAKCRTRRQGVTFQHRRNIDRVIYNGMHN